MRDRGEKLKILLIASNPPPSIDGVDEEVASLNALLPTILGPNNLDLTYIPTEEATYQRIREELRQCPYHILHYAGHGVYDRQSAERTGLPFWTQGDRQGTTQALTAAQIGSLLRDSELRFAYLSSCYGTRAAPRAQLLDDDFLGIADAVIAAGVPAVLGFRWPVSDEGAKELTSHFYTRFFAHESLDLALLEARRHIAQDATGGDDDTWVSPILVVQT